MFTLLKANYFYNYVWTFSIISTLRYFLSLVYLAYIIDNGKTSQDGFPPEVDLLIDWFFFLPCPPQRGRVLYCIAFFFFFFFFLHSRSLRLCISSVRFLTQSQSATVYFFCTISYTVAVCDCVFLLYDFLPCRSIRQGLVSYSFLKLGGFRLTYWDLDVSS